MHPVHSHCHSQFTPVGMCGQVSQISACEGRSLSALNHEWTAEKPAAGERCLVKTYDTG